MKLFIMYIFVANVCQRIPTTIMRYSLMLYTFLILENRSTYQEKKEEMK